jgi:inner membrane transporter RhtA
MADAAQRNAFAGAALIVGGAATIQWSAAIVTPIFGTLGAASTSAWRFLLGAVVLLALTRPNVRQWKWEQWRAALVLGLSVAGMNFCFFQCISRIPLGSGVTIEFLGPLTVAVIGKRSARHVAFAVLAAIGVVVLGHPGGHLTTAGVLFGLGSGLGWAIYIFASAKVGGTTSGFDGLAVSMTVAAVATLPFALGSLHILREHPWIGGRMALVASMSIVLGFALEMQALRRVKPSLVGVLMAFDPAIAFLLGFVVLSQHPSLWDIVGLLCVVVAGVGVTIDQRDADAPTPITP